MKNSIVFACTLLLVLNPTGCKGRGKYADFEKVMNKYIEAMEIYAAAMEGAKSAADAANAIEAHTVIAKDVAPMIKHLIVEHPEFKDMKDLPAELKPIVDRVQAVETKIDGLGFKFREYDSDPKVKAALAKLAKVEGPMK